MNERWVPIAGHDGYEVSDLGRVRCWRPRNWVSQAPTEPRLLNPRARGGYRCVRLGKGGPERPVHLLVLEAFVGPRPAGHVARHVHDRDTSNNALANLAYGTPKQNTADRVVHGTSAHGRKPNFRHPRNLAHGKRHGLYTHPEARARKLAPSRALELRDRYRAGEPRTELSREFGVSKRTVWLVGTERSRRMLAAELEVVS